MESDKQRTGKAGEKLAFQYLAERQYVMIAKNIRVGRLGEIDIICWEPDGVTVCFTEVKTRSSTRFGTPAEAVTAAKQRRIRMMAQLWLQGAIKSTAYHRCYDAPIRFDVIEVMMDKKNNSARVHLIPNAF